MSTAATATTDNPVEPSVIKELPNATILKVYDPKPSPEPKVIPEAKKVEEDKDEDKKE